MTVLEIVHFVAFIGMIITKSKENPHYFAFELVEDCFGPQDRNHVACFGYGTKPKEGHFQVEMSFKLCFVLRKNRMFHYISI